MGRSSISGNKKIEEVGSPGKAELQRKGGSDPPFCCQAIDRGGQSHVLQGQTQIHGHGSLIRTFPPRLPTDNNLPQFSIGRRGRLEILDPLVVLKLGQVIGAQFIHLGQGFKVRAPLHAASEDARNLALGTGQEPGRERGGRTRSIGRDPGTIHNGIGQAGLHIVQDQQAVNVGQSFSATADLPPA